MYSHSLTSGVSCCTWKRFVFVALVLSGSLGQHPTYTEPVTVAGVNKSVLHDAIIFKEVLFSSEGLIKFCYVWMWTSSLGSIKSSMLWPWKTIIITLQISVGSRCPDYTDAFIVVSGNASVLCVEWLRAVSDVVLEGWMSHRHTNLTPLQSFLIDGLHWFHRVTSQVPLKKTKQNSMRFKSTLHSSQLCLQHHEIACMQDYRHYILVPHIQKHLAIHCTCILCHSKYKV